jgi:hypothetical protein
MDRLQIEIAPVPSGWGGDTMIKINGEPLLELIQECELRSAIALGSGRDIAGTYSPLRGCRFEDRLFFGQPRDPQLRHGDRIVLMGCNCGTVGCWPLLAQVQVHAERIVWSAFQQPFRRSWDYSSLEPLTFERAAYEREVGAAARRFNELVTNSGDQRRKYEAHVRVMRAQYPDREWADWATITGHS